jgi:hypothetical protein
MVFLEDANSKDLQKFGSTARFLTKYIIFLKISEQVHYSEI